ncbi:MAG: ABC transporter substrate-binding protein [Clostridia bacterium]
MKNFGKKLVVMVLVVAMTMACFAGCGGGAKATEWYVGSSGPLTGGAAVYGLGVKRGAEIAVKEINAAGGINGAQVKFDIRDDVCDGAQAKTNFNSLEGAGMHVFMGAVTSGASIEAGKEAKEANVFLLTPSGSAQDCTQYDNAFRICFTDPVQGVKSAKYVKDTYPNVKKMGVLYDSSDEYSTGIYKAFKAELKGVDLVEETFTAETKTDFSTQIENFKNKGCEVVFIPFYASEAALFLTQAKSKGLKVPFFGCDGMDGVEGISKDKSVVEGLVFLTAFVSSSTDPKAKNFTDSYVSAYGEKPNQFAADAYDAMYTIKAALEHSKATPDMTASKVCDLMKDAMTKITVKGLTGTMTWNAQGEPSKEAIFTVIKNGEQTPLN